MTKKLVLLSDLHVGATAGLMPPGYVSFEGNTIGQNDYQKWLWSCWKDCWKWARKVLGKDEWICAINGDVIDGNHHNTREIVSVDEWDHVSASIDCLVDVLADAKSVYLTEGTNVHVQNSEHSIANIMKGRGVNVEKPKGKKGAWAELDLIVNGCLVSVDHHVSSSLSSLSESAAFSRTIGDVRNRRSRAGYSVPKVVVRSHRHQYGMYDDGYSKMIILPPWQGNTRFVRRVVPGAIPQCGMVILDWTNTEYAGLPTVHTRIHTASQRNT